MAHTTKAPDQFLSEHEVAARLGLAPCTLRAWRHLGKGPTYLKLGKTIRYRASAMEAYLAACERSPSSGAAA